MVFISALTTVEMKKGSKFKLASTFISLFEQHNTSLPSLRLEVRVTVFLSIVCTCRFGSVVVRLSAFHTGDVDSTLQSGYM